MVAKALPGRKEKDSTVIIVIVAATAAVVTLKSGNGIWMDICWGPLGETLGKRKGVGWGFWGDGCEDNLTYFNREEQNPPLDLIVSTTCVFTDGH